MEGRRIDAAQRSVRPEGIHIAAMDGDRSGAGTSFEAGYEIGHPVFVEIGRGGAESARVGEGDGAGVAGGDCGGVAEIEKGTAMPLRMIRDGRPKLAECRSG